MEENRRKVDGDLVLRLAVVAILAIATVVSIVFESQIYGDSTIFKENPTGIQFVDGMLHNVPLILTTLRVVFFAWLINLVLRTVLSKALSGSKTGVTAVKLINSFLKYIIAIIALLYILSQWGVDTAALVASAGIVTLVVGLGAQSLIADVIAGMFIVFEGEYQVGDIIVVDGWRGTVQEIGIRSTRIVDAGGNVKIINNSEIKSVINQTSDLSVARAVISIEYGESLQRVEVIIRDNIDKLKANIPMIVEGPFYKGVTTLGASSVDLLFLAKCKEEDIYDVQRAMNRELKILFDDNHINIPFPQVVINKPPIFDESADPLSTRVNARRFVNEQTEISKDVEEEL